WRPSISTAFPYTTLFRSTLATNETIFSVVTRLSNSMATLPLKLYKNYEVTHNAASDVLINDPNPNMTGFEFIRNLETARNEKGRSEEHTSELQSRENLVC